LFPDRGDADPRNENKYHRSVFEELPLESSMTSLKIVALPRHLLDLAVTLYIIGFGLYALFLWLDDINQLGTAYRNIFIVFIITVGLFGMDRGSEFECEFRARRIRVRGTSHTNRFTVASHGR